MEATTGSLLFCRLGLHDWRMLKPDIEYDRALGVIVLRRFCKVCGRIERKREDKSRWALEGKIT
jgi:hypothetical protein